MAKGHDHSWLDLHPHMRGSACHREAAVAGRADPSCGGHDSCLCQVMESSYRRLLRVLFKLFLHGILA